MTDINVVKSELRELKGTHRAYTEMHEKYEKDTSKEIKKLEKLCASRLALSERLTMQWEEISTRYFNDTEYRNAYEYDLSQNLSNTQLWYQQTLEERDHSRGAHEAESALLTDLLDQAHAARGYAEQKQQRAEDDLAFELTHIATLWPKDCKGNHIIPTILKDHLPSDEQIELDRQAEELQLQLKLAEEEKTKQEVEGENSFKLADTSASSTRYLTVKLSNSSSQKNVLPGSQSKTMTRLNSAASNAGLRNYLNEADDDTYLLQAPVKAFTLVPESEYEVSLFSIASEDDYAMDNSSKNVTIGFERAPDIYSGTETEEWSGSDITSDEDKYDDAKHVMNTTSNNKDCSIDINTGDAIIDVPENFDDITNNKSRRELGVEEIAWQAEWRKIHLQGTPARQQIRRQHREASSKLLERRKTLANAIRYQRRRLLIAEEEADLIANELTLDSKDTLNTPSSSQTDAVLNAASIETQQVTSDVLAFANKTKNKETKGMEI